MLSERGTRRKSAIRLSLPSGELHTPFCLGDRLYRRNPLTVGGQFTCAVLAVEQRVTATTVVQAVANERPRSALSRLPPKGLDQQEITTNMTLTMAKPIAR